MKLEAQRKDKERQEEEEVTEDLKRFTMQEMARGLSVSDEALLVFEAQEPNIEQYIKATAAVENAIQCYCVICDQEKKKKKRERATTQAQTKPWVHQDPRKGEVTSTRDYARPAFECLSLPWRHGSAVACHNDKGSNCSSPLRGMACGISPLGGGHH